MNAPQNSTAIPTEAPLVATARHKHARLPTVLAMRGGMSKSALYDEMKRGVWPRPVRISRRMVVWPLDECERLCAARIAGADNQEMTALCAELVASRQHRI